MHRVNNILGHLKRSPDSQLSTESCSFSDVKLAPPNAIFLTKKMFKADKDPRRVNLGIGAYRDNDGKPWVLPSVRAAEQIVVNDHSLNHEYFGQNGDAEFAQLAQGLLFGESSEAVRSGRIGSVQSLSGTGSLRLGFTFLKQQYPNATVWLSNPTWGNHPTVCKTVGFQTRQYRYWDAQKRGLNFEGMKADLASANRGDIVLLHTCAHNPTGVDPTPAQWRELYTVISRAGLIPFFDTAYQGFASGDLAKDGYSLRYFTQQGMELVAAQSFAKNFGLYNERIGAFHVVTRDAGAAKACQSQLALIVRPMYSNPPAFGSRIVKTILKNGTLYRQWQDEVVLMSNRINDMRQALYDEITKLGTPGTWEHILTQIGMFTFTGLNKAQCEVMIKDWHVYLLKSGRISMAGLNTGNVKHVAKAIDYCVRNVN